MEYVVRREVFLVEEPALVWNPTPAGHILLVDDDEAIRAVAAELLRDAGYLVREAASAEAALTLVATAPAPCDLLITDMDMPGLNGLELADRLRVSLAGLRVLVISGGDPDELRPKLPAGSFLLTKPFRMTDFLGRVKELVTAKP